jgi:hypothetical protein
MITDKILWYSDGQTGITSSAGSTYWVDAAVAGDALKGSELTLVVRIKTSLTSGSSVGYLAVSLQTDSDSGFATSNVTLLSSAATIVTALTAGTVVLRAKIPVGLKRYSRVYYTVTGESLSGGAIDAFLTPDADVGL